MVRDVVLRIGSKLGLDLIGQDLMADLDGIEEALAAAEELHLDADDDGQASDASFLATGYFQADRPRKYYIPWLRCALTEVDEK